MEVNASQSTRERGVLTAQAVERTGAHENLRRQVVRFRQNRLAVGGLVVVLVLVLIAIVGPYFVPYPADTTGAVHSDRQLQAPSVAHPFGTDDVGDDIFSRVVDGARLSLGVGILVVIIGTGIGVPLGALSGYFGGVTESVIMRVTDIFLTIPALILALAIAAALGPSLRNAMLAIALVWWPGYCRLTQGQFLSLRQRTYVDAARALGARDTRVIFRHILPNALTPILVKMSMDIGFAILVAAALGFIGVGAQPPTPEWGSMVALARTYLPNWWWDSTFPGLAIFITVFAFNMLGDGLRDVFDPQGAR
ncbi:MAG TPA: ABC transporter permease [Nitrolancea sp.]|jgi:peptide/nickel transport system permease protein|nr:ABC transporter permease [Nitrolancea sp.]